MLHLTNRCNPILPLLSLTHTVYAIDMPAVSKYYFTSKMPILDEFHEQLTNTALQDNVRLRQRRSRENTKRLLNDCKERLQKYKPEGVEASSEI